MRITRVKELKGGCKTTISDKPGGCGYCGGSGSVYPKCPTCGLPGKPFDDGALAIRLLGNSRWYQDGNMDAESLMNVLEALAASQRREVFLINDLIGREQRVTELLAERDQLQARLDANMPSLMLSALKSIGAVVWDAEGTVRPGCDPGDGEGGA